MTERTIADLRRQLMSFEANIQMEALQNPTERIQWQAQGVRRAVQFVFNFIQKREGL